MFSSGTIALPSGASSSVHQPRYRRRIRASTSSAAPSTFAAEDFAQRPSARERDDDDDARAPSRLRSSGGGGGGGRYSSPSWPSRRSSRPQPQAPPPSQATASPRVRAPPIVPPSPSTWCSSSLSRLIDALELTESSGIEMADAAMVVPSLAGKADHDVLARVTGGVDSPAESATPRPRTTTTESDDSAVQIITLKEDSSRRHSDASSLMVQRMVIAAEDNTAFSLQSSSNWSSVNGTPASTTLFFPSSSGARSRNNSDQSGHAALHFDSDRRAGHHKQSYSLSRTLSFSSPATSIDAPSTAATSAYASTPVTQLSLDAGKSPARGGSTGWVPTTTILLSTPEPSSTLTRKKSSTEPTILDPRFSFPIRKGHASSASTQAARGSGVAGGQSGSFVASLGLAPLIVDGQLQSERSPSMSATRHRSHIDSTISTDTAPSVYAYTSPSVVRASEPSISAITQTSLQPPFKPTSMGSGARKRKSKVKSPPTPEHSSIATGGRARWSAVRRHPSQQSPSVSSPTSPLDEPASLHIHHAIRWDIPAPARIEMHFPTGPHSYPAPNTTAEAYTFPHPQLQAHELDSEPEDDNNLAEVLRSRTSIDASSVRRVLRENEEFRKEREGWSDSSAGGISSNWGAGGVGRRRRRTKISSTAMMRKTPVRATESPPLPGSFEPFRKAARSMSRSRSRSRERKPKASEARLHRDPALSQHDFDLDVQTRFQQGPRRVNLGDRRTSPARGGSDSPPVIISASSNRLPRSPAGPIRRLPSADVRSARTRARPLLPHQVGEALSPPAASTASSPHLGPQPVEQQNAFAALPPHLHHLLRRASSPPMTTTPIAGPSSSITRPIYTRSRSSTNDKQAFIPSRAPPPVPQGVVPFSPYTESRRTSSGRTRSSSDSTAGLAIALDQQPRSEDKHASALSDHMSELFASNPAPLQSCAELSSPVTLTSPTSPASIGSELLDRATPVSFHESLDRPSIASLRRARARTFGAADFADDTFGMSAQRHYSAATVESSYSQAVDDDGPPTLDPNILPTPISEFGSLRDSYASSAMSTMTASAPLHRNSKQAPASPESGSRSGSRQSSVAGASHGSGEFLDLDEEDCTFKDLFFRPPPSREEPMASDERPLSVASSGLSRLRDPGSDGRSTPQQGPEIQLETLASEPPTPILATNEENPRSATSMTTDSFETAEEGPELSLFERMTPVRVDSPGPVEELRVLPEAAKDPTARSPTTLTRPASTWASTSFADEYLDTPTSETVPFPLASTPDTEQTSFLDMSPPVSRAPAFAPTEAPRSESQQSFLQLEDSQGDISQSAVAEATEATRRSGAARISDVPKDESFLPVWTPPSSPRNTLVDLASSSSGPTTVSIEVALALAHGGSEHHSADTDEELLSPISSFPSGVSPRSSSTLDREGRVQSLSPDHQLSSVRASMTSSSRPLTAGSRGSGASAWSSLDKFPQPPTTMDDLPRDLNLDNRREQETEPRLPTPTLSPSMPEPEANFAFPSLPAPELSDVEEHDTSISETRTIQSQPSFATLRRNRSAPNLNSRSSLTIDTDNWTIAASTLHARSEDDEDDDDEAVRRVVASGSGPAGEALPDVPSRSFLDVAMSPTRSVPSSPTRRRVWSLTPTFRTFFSSAPTTPAEPIVSTRTGDARPKSTGSGSSSRRSSMVHSERTMSDPSVHQSAWPEGPEERSR